MSVESIYQCIMMIEIVAPFAAGVFGGVPSAGKESPRRKAINSEAINSTKSLPALRMSYHPENPSGSVRCHKKGHSKNHDLSGRSADPIVSWTAEYYPAEQEQQSRLRVMAESN